MRRTRIRTNGRSIPTTLRSEWTEIQNPGIDLTFCRFIDSEADLDLALKALLPLAQSPVLAYPEIIKSGAVERLVGLLSHENMDIVIDVVEVINEFTDEDEDDVEAEEEEEGSREEALKQLIKAFVRPSAAPLPPCVCRAQRTSECKLNPGVAGGQPQSFQRRGRV